jgi:hypothetical protein
MPFNMTSKEKKNILEVPLRMSKITETEMQPA